MRDAECTLCLEGPEGIVPNVDCPIHGFSRVRDLLMAFVEGEGNVDDACEAVHGI